MRHKSLSQQNTSSLTIWSSGVALSLSTPAVLVRKIYDGKTAEESERLDLLKAMRFCEMRLNQLNEEGIL